MASEAPESSSEQTEQLSQNDFYEKTKDPTKFISPQLTTALKRYATHSPFNRAEIISDTSELEKENQSEERENDICDLLDVLTSKNYNIQKVSIQSGNPEVTANDAFSDILEILGLDKYYPSKLSLLDAMAITKPIVNTNIVDLPWMIIHKLLMTDYRARDFFWPLLKESKEAEKPDFDFDDAQSIIDDNDDKTTDLNTLDVMVAIFTCCDNFLKQIFAQKMFVCKLAIPFLYTLGPERNIVMSLWALRMITVQWHAKGERPIETPVTEKAFPMVSFVRLGRPPISKSKLMNNILRDESHDTFFNHDCNNGTVDRRLTDGLVECSWFITANKEKETLPCTTMFLNLRGDASSMDKQMQILQDMSSVVFVVVTTQDLVRSPHTKTFQQIWQSGVKVIVLLISGNIKQSTQEVLRERRACVEALGKDFKQIPYILSHTSRGFQKNASELKIEARRQLSDVIGECSGVLLEECARLAETRGFIIDEYDDQACLEGKIHAKLVLSNMKDKQLVDCKTLLLPMQGAEWIEYCQLQKEQHRISAKSSQSSSIYPNDDSETTQQSPTIYQAERIKQKMDRLREKQIETCQNGLNPLIKDFMLHLRKTPDVVLYFLKWMNLLLDEQSRSTLPGLRREYHTLWTKYQEPEKKQEILVLQQLKALVDKAEHQLVNASFGLENIFRELGQIYEAVKGSKKIGIDTRECVEYLPEIAAELLMKGIPLELVDGDASSVPISWVCAVLDKLGNIIGNKRLFVLSVLGIQSSGKSTLLNTMFGLQFAVSAGRCTRGAYMQLVPVDKCAELPFDYIVVVDTEGLRAPELGQLKYEHDNELATLVIGLGDVTMINIKGENKAEMKDILQIAVHAFLRMNLVGKQMQNHRTGIFVHQNVSAADAEEVMRHGCQKLKEVLNDMTREAAQSENIANVNSFTQIIKFDVKKHVWYFPDLWHGSPPMAPVNPDYSEKVSVLKVNLLREIAKKQTTFLTTSDLSIRLADLWNGVLADDFVFNFRNSLEVKAYNSLQSEYYTLEWKMQNALSTWLQKAEIKIKRCENIQDLDNSFEALTIDLPNDLEKSAQEIKTCLKRYFEDSNLQEILYQWQQSKLNQLDFAVERQQDEGKAELISIKEARRVEILHTQMYGNHEEHFMKKAVDLADEQKGKKATDSELEKKFEDMWNPMVHELAIKTEERELRIDLVMESTLLRIFHAHHAILKNELRCRPLNSPLEQTYLENSITVDFVEKEHISLKTTWEKAKTRITSITGASYQEIQARDKTCSLSSSILQEISTYLKGISKQNIKFQQEHASEVLRKLAEKIEAFNKNAQKSEDCTFTIVPKYVVKLAVHVSRFCVPIFSDMQFEYNKKHGVKAKLDEYKTTARRLFENLVMQKTEEFIAGDLLCTKIKGVIREAVKREIPRKCVEEVLIDFQMNKYTLIKQILIDLAMKENFNDYKQYINNTKEFALRWITKYTNKKMFSKKEDSGMSTYAQLTEIHIKKIIRCVARSVEHATCEVQGLEGMRIPLWIEKFCHKVSEELGVPIGSLKQIRDRQVKDFSNLQRIILDMLDKGVQASLVNEFSRQTKTSVDWNGTPPPQQILDRLWGCPEQCPFCKEPCADTTADHFEISNRSHSCVQHRPMGIGGARWDKTRSLWFGRINVTKGQLQHESCNYFIQWRDFKFNCKDCNYKCKKSGKCADDGKIYYHHSTTYRKFIKDWDIAPDSTNRVSQYWMWFMKTFNKDLTKMHRAKSPRIPSSWHAFMKEDAIKDLEIYRH